MKSVKINITLPDELLVRLDDEARKQCMTRSGLLQMAAREYLGRTSVTSDAICDLARAVLSAYTQ